MVTKSTQITPLWDDVNTFSFHFKTIGKKTHKSLLVFSTGETSDSTPMKIKHMELDLF